ncbi:MAG: hypothetical protein K0R73_43 [Candidatus Midichloriaceae bacterium]|jgi:hypothetical protein|nr:hypothetical protein [Candidatus Midichloriaceae bacterium]
MRLRGYRETIRNDKEFRTKYREYIEQGRPEASRQDLEKKFNALGESERSFLAKELGMTEKSLEGINFERFEELEKQRRAGQGVGLESSQEEEEGKDREPEEQAKPVQQAIAEEDKAEAEIVVPETEVVVEEVKPIAEVDKEVVRAQADVEKVAVEEIAETLQPNYEDIFRNAIQNKNIKGIEISINNVSPEIRNTLFQQEFTSLLGGADNLAVVQVLYTGIDKDKINSVEVGGLEIPTQGVDQWDREKVDEQREAFKQAKALPNQEDIGEEVAEASVTEHEQEAGVEVGAPKTTQWQSVAGQLVDDSLEDLERKAPAKPRAQDTMLRPSKEVRYSDLLTQEKLSGDENGKKKAIKERMLISLGALGDARTVLSANEMFQAKVNKLYNNYYNEYGALKKGYNIETAIARLEEDVNNERKNMIMQAYMNTGSIRNQDVRGNNHLFDRHGKDAEKAWQNESINAEQIIDGLNFQRKEDLGFRDAPGEYLVHKASRAFTYIPAAIMRAPGNIMHKILEDKTKTAKWCSGMAAMVFLLIPGLAPFALASAAVYVLIYAGEVLKNNETVKFLGKIVGTLVFAPLETLASSALSIVALAKSLITGEKFTEAFDGLFGYKPFSATKFIWSPAEQKASEIKPFENKYESMVKAVKKDLDDGLGLTGIDRGARSFVENNSDIFKDFVKASAPPSASSNLPASPPPAPNLNQTTTPSPNTSPTQTTTPSPKTPTQTIAQVAQSEEARKATQGLTGVAKPGGGKVQTDIRNFFPSKEGDSKVNQI